MAIRAFLESTNSAASVLEPTVWKNEVFVMIESWLYIEAIICYYWISIQVCISIICVAFSYVLGGCPFHGRVERDEIPTRESPPKQSGTR